MAENTEPDPWVRALARERAMFKSSERKDAVIAVDEQLAALGWCVDQDGRLVPVPTEVVAPKTKARPARDKETAVVEPAPETAVED